MSDEKNPRCTLIRRAQRECQSLRQADVFPDGPRAGQPLTDADREGATRGMEDWVGEDVLIDPELERYRHILESKIERAIPAGFEPYSISESLFDWQRAIVAWAIRAGRAALFCDTGLGKTPMQLEWSRQVAMRTERPVLILAPLAVSYQTCREGEKFSIPVTVCHAQEDALPGVNVTNYERLHLFDTSAFSGVVLDESSILKSFMGKTKRQLTDAFAGTPYKLCCTATPAPNDHTELCNHAEFLNHGKRDQILPQWFINDTEHTGDWRLKRHAEADFWRWVATWAVCISNPSDIGFDGTRYILPPLNIHNHIVDVSHLPPTDGTLFRGARDISATGLHQEMRITAPYRARKVAEIINGSHDPWLVWVNTDYEADAVMELLPGAVEVRGSMSDERKEDRLAGFADGTYRVLVTKPSIAGFGLNYQHCARVAFMGLSYSYEQFYQAIRRCWRFGQTRPVDAHVISAESEGSVLESIRRKERAHIEMKRRMIQSMSDETLRQIEGARTLNVDIPHEKHDGKGWTLYHGDCVQVTRELPDESVGLSIFSPPFANLFTYSDSIADMGNTKDWDQFFSCYDLLAKQLLRITETGRLACVHCSDLPSFASFGAPIGIRDLPGEIIRSMQRAGWVYHSRITIWKCPVVEMTRTKALGLLYKQLIKDSARSRQGMPDWVLVFRKNGECRNPVTQDKQSFPVEQWQKWASPVWMDIDQTDTLNYQQARGNRDERHICPLQLGVIERCVRLWSNPGDVVFSPFAGIGSEGYIALQNRRQFLGIELKDEYVKVALTYLAEGANADQICLFDEAQEPTA